MQRISGFGAPVAAALMAVALLAGCQDDNSTPLASAGGGSPASPPGAVGSAGPGSGVAPVADPRKAGKAFVTCMRDRGQEIVDPPDPDDPRSAIRHELDVNRRGDDMKFQEALETCVKILPEPPPADSPDTKENAAVEAALHEWTQCLRSNGLPDFPDLGGSAWVEYGADPATGTAGPPRFPPIPPEVQRSCKSLSDKLDAAQERAAREHAKKRG